MTGDSSFNSATSFLDSALLGRIRRNHGLEHATMNILARKRPGLALAGHSNPNGFWILGNVPTDLLEQAVLEALTRLRQGEEKLAIHPNCGTNIATAGILAGASGALAMLGVGSRRRDKVERLPLAITLATLALVIAQPIGLFLQASVTTSGRPGNLQVVDIIPTSRGRVRAHRVVTRG